MANTLFAPQVRAIQPAFIYPGGVYIYFSLSSFNTLDDISLLRYSLIDPNQASTWGNNSKLKNKEVPYNEASISTTNITDDGEYYIYLTASNVFDTLTVNQFYQMQLWFVGKDGSISESSQVTLLRPIANHTLTCPNGDVYELNEFSGAISDTVEVLSSITCQIGTDYIKNGICSGQQYYFSLDDYPFIEGEKYTLKFSYETIHGYTRTIESECTLKQPGTLGGFTVGSIWEDTAAAAVKITYEGGQKGDIIERASEEDNYTTWKKVGTLSDTSATVDNPWGDYTIQSEIKYKYRVARWISDSKKIMQLISPAIEGVRSQQEIFSVPFENIILSDKNFSLNICYNPNITGVKFVTQENVTNTLGGKYPLIRRNGDTYYEQFNLSGMIYIDCTNYENANLDSRNSSTNLYFKDDASLLFLTYFSAFGFSQSNNQLILEKKARDLVIKLLTDGRPKLFRSFEEGNIICYLSNVSFTPNKQLGRHIYDFSATVTQLCDYTFDNLHKYQLNNNYYTEFMTAISHPESLPKGVFYNGEITVTKEV